MIQLRIPHNLCLPIILLSVGLLLACTWWSVAVEEPRIGAPKIAPQISSAPESRLPG